MAKLDTYISHAPYVECLMLTAYIVLPAWSNRLRDEWRQIPVFAIGQATARAGEVYALFSQQKIMV